MLKSWSIKNFKPIVDSGELQLAPVTVFAGRNSSGKSSLLQSILMISQTLGSRLLDRPLLPNERLVQLGTFEDILSEIIHSRILELGVGLEMESEEIKTPSRLRGNTRLDIKSAKFLVRFNSASANGTSSSAIEAAKVVVENVLVTAQAERITAERLIPSEAPQQLTFEELMDPHQISFSLKKATNQDIQHFLRNVPQEYSQIFSLTNNNSNYLGIFNDNNTITLLTEDNREYQYLVALSHFLPSRLIRKYNLDKRQKENLMRSIRIFLDIGDLSLNKFPESIKGLIDHPISSDLREAINGLCLKMHIVSNFSGQNILELVAWLRKLEERSAILSDVQKLIVENMLSNDNEQGNLEGLEVIHREELEQTTEQIAAFFTSKIRYLGPLRADPQASQKFGPSSELDDVGAKGEYAAAVYEANQSANINWYNPYSQRVERKKLKEALDSWAQYLGVAQQIKTEMAGLSGVSWKIIHKEGRKPRSLPEVGVGVSQILPILVMGLLSPTGSLLLIEQPELHLHPYVQARLGDFFMGLAKCKKQCIIETHSENLVSQLRLHVVQAGGLEKSDCMIYFVDQDERGAAKFEKIRISERGNILNWPEGFFDESMIQEDKITAASLRRRAKLAKQENNELPSKDRVNET